MAGRLPRVTGAVGAVDTADQGYFIGVSIYFPVVATAAIVGSADEIRVTQFVLPFRVTVGKIVIEISTGSASGKMGIALYDKDSNLVLESGAISTTSTGVISTSITAVTIEPGVYFLADTADNTTVQTRKVTFPTQVRGLMNKQTVKKHGTGANSSTAAVFPSTIGAISDASNTPTMALFEP